MNFPDTTRYLNALAHLSRADRLDLIVAIEIKDQRIVVDLLDRHIEGARGLQAVLIGDHKLELCPPTAGKPSSEHLAEPSGVLLANWRNFARRIGYFDIPVYLPVITVRIGGFGIHPVALARLDAARRADRRDLRRQERSDRAQRLLRSGEGSQGVRGLQREGIVSLLGVSLCL